MIVNKLLYCVVVSLVLVSCGSQNGSKGISGTAIGSEGEMVTLYRFANQKPLATDSTLIADDGSFTLQANPALDLNFYLLSVDDLRSLMIMTDSSESLNIEVQGEDWSNDWSVQGSKQTGLLHEFSQGFNPMMNEYNDLVLKVKTPGTMVEVISQSKVRLKEISSDMTQYCNDFIENNSGEPASFVALSGLNPKTDSEAFEKLLTSTKESFGESFQYTMVKQQVDAIKKQKNAKKLPSTPQSTSQGNAAYSIGEQAPELKFNDPDGNSRALSDLKGKVVLIDFWASWCGPCRRENPNVVKAYEKYKSKGFDIFSVSLDKDLNKWKAAIEKDGLLWPNHVSDLLGWQSAASAAYGVRSIPHTVLVAKDGTVIGANLRGPMLERKLAEILGE